MKKSNELIIHIGIWKTGTTTIQNTLLNNALLLRQRNICYPSISANHTFLASAFHSEPDNFIVSKTKGIKGRDLNEWHKQCLEQFEKEIQGFETTIVSSEFLLDLPLKQIEKLKYYLQNLFSSIKVVIYMRHPVDHLSSAINEQVKQGHYGLDTAYEIHGKALEYEKVEEWINAFGKNNIKMRSFERVQLINNDIVDDFLSIIGENKLTLEIKHLPVEKNKSLSGEAIQVSDALIRLLARNGMQKGNTDYLLKIKGIPYQAPVFLMEKTLSKVEPYLEKYKKEFGLTFVKNGPEIIEDVRLRAPMWEGEALESIAAILNGNSLQLSKLKSDNFRLKALLNLEKGAVKDAENEFKKSVKSGVHFESQRDYATFLNKEGKFTEALIYCNKAIQLKPDRLWVKELKEEIKQKINKINLKGKG